MDEFKEKKDIPHLTIKKVARSSQKHMEEFVKQIGNVDSVYYAKTENDYPYMFVVFTKESSLYRAYVRINEQFTGMYEVSLKPLVPKVPMYCLECMKESFYFCESCSAPFCSDKCQKRNWPQHAANCITIP